FHVHPASLAAKLAAIDYGNKKKRREMNALFQPLLKLLHRPHALVAEIKSELPQEPLIGFLQHALGELIDHACAAAAFSAASAFAFAAAALAAIWSAEGSAAITSGGISIASDNFCKHRIRSFSALSSSLSFENRDFALADRSRSA